MLKQRQHSNPIDDNYRYQRKLSNEDISKPRHYQKLNDDVGRYQRKNPTDEAFRYQRKLSTGDETGLVAPTYQRKSSLSGSEDPRYARKASTEHSASSSPRIPRKHLVHDEDHGYAHQSSSNSSSFRSDAGYINDPRRKMSTASSSHGKDLYGREYGYGGLQNSGPVNQSHGAYPQGQQHYAQHQYLGSAGHQGNASLDTGIRRGSAEALLQSVLDECENLIDTLDDVDLNTNNKK